MVTPIPFDPNRFQSAARHYFARQNYSPRLVANVARATGLTTSDRVMDLGCGPGFLALAFAPFAGEIIAVDPSGEMLAAGREAAAAQPGGSKVIFAEGSSNDLQPEMGPCRLVTMGRSFHWMDRAETLRRLDRIVVPGGAVVLFDVDTITEGAGDWHAEFGAITERYAVRKAEWRDPDWVRHEVFLVDSAFSVVEGLTVTERRRFPASQLVDRAFSLSRTAPDALGPQKAAALAAELAELAGRIAIDGMISEVLQSIAIIAGRP